MTVTASQIAKAQARGLLVNVEALAAACNEYRFPFHLACVIMAKETSGRNIYGHDHGGAFSDPNGRNIEVTEANYKQFLKLIGAGKTSNGVGPFQLTYKGYHIGPQSLTTLGYKAWDPADNIRYGVGRILAPSLKANASHGARAFWYVAKAYNGNSSYADDAVARAKTWKALVGTADMESTPPTPPEEPMPLTQEDWDRLHAMIESVVTSPKVITKLAEGVWNADIIPAGDDEPNPKNTAWRPATFLRKTYNLLTPKKP